MTYFDIHLTKIAFAVVWTSNGLGKQRCAKKKRNGKKRKHTCVAIIQVSNGVASGLAMQ